MPVRTLEMTISTDYGDLEDMPVAVDYEATCEPEDRSVGYAGGWVISTSPEIISGGGLDRANLIKLAGEAEITRLEEWASDHIQDRLDNGELDVEDAENERWERGEYLRDRFLDRLEIAAE